MSISARAVLVVLACCLACAGVDEHAIETVAAAARQPLTADRAKHDIASQVYAALVSGAVHHGVSGAEMLVRDEQIAVRAVGSSARAEWLRQFEGMPVQLQEALQRPPDLDSGPVDRSLFPSGTRFISRREIDKALAGSLTDSWTRFRSQFRAAGWVSYSDVLVTSEGLDALVYTEAYCGDLCGQGTYIWLRRSGPSAPWSIATRVVSWIS